jgi:hypothetical protein
MKKLLLIILIVLLFAVFGFVLISKQKDKNIVYQKTVEISKEYLALRYRTDEVLANAESYTDYETWDEEVSNIVKDWEKFEKEASNLEGMASRMIQEDEISLVNKVGAYDTKEVQSIIEKAPAGKTVRTLAQHFGVDMRKAQLILNQSQDMTTREAWGEAGDAFEKLENQAIVVKDTCKVAVYVGGVVATGGAAGFAAAGTVAQVTTVVVGVDLALEVTEDGAQIALGDKNKVSSFVKDVRTVTEPIATVLTITNIPGNLGNAFGRFEAVNVGLEEFRASAQEGKVIGIDLKNFKYQPPFQVIKNTKYPGEITVAELEKAEVEDWIKSINKDYTPMTNEEVKEFVEDLSKELEHKESIKDEPKETSNVESNEKKEESSSDNNEIQIIKIVNVSSDSYMMDTCFSSTCWDNLDADPSQDRDLGGIYTLGKVFGNGEGFETGFRISDMRSDKVTLYFAIAPFEGPKNKTIEYGTWLSESIEITPNYKDEPVVIEWDGSTLRQAK